MIVTTEWHRCKGCLKLQVFFRKRATNYHDGARPTKIMQNEQQMSSIMIIRGSFAEKKSCRPFSAKQPLIIMMELICGKRPMKTRHPLYFHHPVRTCDSTLVEIEYREPIWKECFSWGAIWTQPAWISSWWQRASPVFYVSNLEYHGLIIRPSLNRSWSGLTPQVTDVKDGRRPFYPTIWQSLEFVRKTVLE